MIRLIIKLRIYFLVFLLILPSILSLFSIGLPPTHDGEYHIIRFYEFYKVLSSGVLYPIWASDLNYTFGSPLFLYVYPLPNYVAAMAHFFGLSFIDAFKFNLILASVIGAIGMYTYGKYKFGIWGGILAAVSYTYAPYHLLDIYVRGSVGEVWALAFSPLFFYFFDQGIQKRKIIFSLLAGVVFALIIFSHNILSVMFLGLVVSYSAFLLVTNYNPKKNTLFIIASIFSGILLSSVFIIPALFEQHYVVGLKVFSIFDHFPEVYQLIIPSWGSGYSGIASGTQMSFQIGVANFLIFAVILYGIWRKKIDKSKRKFVQFFICIFIFSIFLITPYSKFIYEFFPYLQVFQFPWRFLSIVIFSGAILAGSITLFYKSKTLYVTVIAITIFSTVSYANAPFYHMRNDSYYISSENFLYGTNSIGNAFQTKWLSQQKHLPKGSGYLKSSKKVISARLKIPVSQGYSLHLASPDSLILHTAYFPGWEGYVNSKKVELQNANGLIEIPIEKGQNEVELVFTDTPIRSVAKIISIVTFLMIILIIIRKFATIKT